MTKEIKEIPKGTIIPFATNYLVTTTGVIYHKNGRRLSQYFNNGYKRVSLVTNSGKRKDFAVHRIVGEVFIPNPEDKPFINHINGVKDDNRVENLEWCTPKENSQHAVKAGLMLRLENHPRTSLTKEKVVEIYKRLLQGETSIRLSEEYNLTPSCVADISKRRSWKEYTRDLPDIGSLAVRSRISDENVHKICQGLVNKMTAKDIIKSLGDTNITVHQIYDIKRRRYCREISSQYTW